MLQMKAMSYRLRFPEKKSSWRADLDNGALLAPRIYNLNLETLRGCAVRETLIDNLSAIHENYPVPCQGIRRAAAKTLYILI